MAVVNNRAFNRLLILPKSDSISKFMFHNTRIMGKKRVFIILASQDFISANHHSLWLEIAEQSGCHVYVANIMADYITSVLKGKFNRIREARHFPNKITENLTVFRPLVWARAEILPDCLFSIVRRGFWKSMKMVDSEIMNKQVCFIFYNAYWAKILKGSHPDMKFAYYLFDEVRYNGNDYSINTKRYKQDEYACRNADVIFTMTKMLAKSRAVYNGNIHVMGNGSVLPLATDKPLIKHSRSVAFIGNFRNWINESMLEQIIQCMPNVLFAFAGPVETNMQEFLKKLLNTYNNTMYFGKVTKDRMTQLYRMFNVVIIPYNENPFIQATRPIKIVESVLAGTPVVTVPINGYDECEFIRFATNKTEFCEQINYLLNNSIDMKSKPYLDFCVNNTWQKIASRIIESFN